MYVYRPIWTFEGTDENFHYFMQIGQTCTEKNGEHYELVVSFNIVYNVCQIMYLRDKFIYC